MKQNSTPSYTLQCQSTDTTFGDWNLKVNKNGERYEVMECGTQKDASYVVQATHHPLSSLVLLRRLVVHLL